MTNRINNLRTNSNEPLSTRDTICVVGLALTFITVGTALAVRKCTGEAQPDKSKVEMSMTLEKIKKSGEGQTATLRDEPKIVLRESGKELSDSSNRKKLYLAKVAEKVDPEAAAVIYNLIKEICAEEYLAFDADAEAKRAQCQDFSGASPRSKCETDLFSSAIVECRVVPQPLEQRLSCPTIVFEKHKFVCDGESEESPQEICLKQAGITADQVWNDGEELKKTCPRQEAENLGVDLDTVIELNKIAQTERLKKQRDKFLTGDKTPSQEDIEEYKSTINNIFADDVLKDFGNIDAFGYEYIYDVTESWKAYGEQFEGDAVQLEERWETGRFYYIVAKEVESGTTYYTD